MTMGAKLSLCLEGDRQIPISSANQKRSHTLSISLSRHAVPFWLEASHISIVVPSMVGTASQCYEMFVRGTALISLDHDMNGFLYIF